MNNTCGGGVGDGLARGFSKGVTTRARRWVRPWARRSAGLATIALAAALAPGCAGTPDEIAEPDEGEQRRDFLHDTADDGSLVAGLKDENPLRRWLAARGLSRLPALADPSPLITALAGEAEPDVAAALCFALGRWSAKGAREPLRRSTNHPDVNVRSASLDALSRLADDRLTPVFVEALEDSRPAIRSAGALGLARLDSRRAMHERLATESMLGSRDDALALAVSDDPDPGVRWRAAYALSAIPPRPTHVPALREAMSEPTEPLVRAFAMRSLLYAAREGLADDASALARVAIDDSDERVMIEAARLLVDRTADIAACHELLDLVATDAGDEFTRPAAVRHLVWSHMSAARARARAARADDVGADAGFNALDERIRASAEGEAAPWVRRAAKVALATLAHATEVALADLDSVATPVPEAERGRTNLAGRTLVELARSLDRRDREAAATLIGDETLSDDDLLTELLLDDSPTVVAAILPVLGDDRLSSLWSHLRSALDSNDTALVGIAAATSADLVKSGRAPPWLMTALAEALERADADFALEEARVELAAALMLPPLAPVPPTVTPAGTLLDRLEALHLAALEDPSPRVQLETTRGPVIIQLDRVTAPRHVQSFLEQVDDGSYEGLSWHRVVPDFVVQGLDPRGDGWGVGDRRVPDEFSPSPYLTGTVGMPRVDRPHTGGCQIFVTHLPTPRLDGDYTVFGQVIDGMDAISALEVGDVVTTVRRLDG